MTINTIVCFFVLVQAETAPDVKVLAVRNFRTQKRIQTFLTRCVRTFTPHREHITIIIYLTQLNAGPEFRFGNFSLSQVFTILTRILASSVQIIPWTLGSPFLSFLYNGGFCALADGLTKRHKSYGGGGGGVQLYIYVGP